MQFLLWGASALRDVGQHLWVRAVPYMIALIGTTCFVVDNSNTVLRIIGAGFLMWAIDLAFERGKMATDKRWTSTFVSMLLNGGHTEWTVNVREHREKQ